MKKNILYGAAGVVGAGLIGWKSFFPWIGYDIETAKKLHSIRKDVDSILKSGDFMIDLFEKYASKHPQKVMLIYEDTEYSFDFVNQQANRVANIVKSWNVGLGETVAIMIYNEPAFAWTFIGLQKLGIAAGMINFNIRKEALSYSVSACEAKYLIVGQGKELLDAVRDVESELKIPVYVQDDAENLPDAYISFNYLMSLSHPVPISKARRGSLTLLTPLGYIFTSGTTGLPKAAIIRQTKGLGYSKYMMSAGVHENDVIYNTLPLYHSAGGGLGLCLTISLGATMVLRKKFSASNFFADCRRHNVTVIQYIGELLRYLLAQPKSPLDTQHTIRVAFGNGLRKDIWADFQERFKIPHMVEFFGATDGTGAFVNLNNKVGAAGRHSPILTRMGLSLNVLVKYDEYSASPIRDRRGRCVRISPGERGLVLSPIPPELKEMHEKFYRGRPEEDEKKVVRNVLVDGDMYFNFGDVLYLDKDYFVYFHDRIGDTFRWKGENVSTTEVANSLTSIDFIEDVNVYGVEVPGSEGKAGMAAIFLTNREEPVTEVMLSVIYTTCKEKLPSYARPIFLRFPKDMPLTSTFKHRKVDLRKEGYDPNVVSDPLFFMDEKLNKYVPLTQEVITMLTTRSKL